MNVCSASLGMHQARVNYGWNQQLQGFRLFVFKVTAQHLDFANSCIPSDPLPPSHVKERGGLRREAAAAARWGHEGGADTALRQQTVRGRAAHTARHLLYLNFLNCTHRCMQRVSGGSHEHNRAGSNCSTAKRRRMLQRERYICANGAACAYMMPRSKVHLNPLRWLFSHSRLTILMVRESVYHEKEKGGSGGDLNAMSSYGGPA